MFSDYELDKDVRKLMESIAMLLTEKLLSNLTGFIISLRT